MKYALQIIPIHLLSDYLKKVPLNLSIRFNALHDASISTNTFSFYTSVSAMASSKIEGEQMEIDSYVKHKMLQVAYREDLVEKPNDLYNAYLFAQKNTLTEKSFLEAHRLLSTHLLNENKRGRYRTGNMVVLEHKTYRIQYEAAPGSEIKTLTKKFWNDIAYLQKQQLSIEETFFFASSIHLAFVNIHPFEDGNGRAARLLEK